MFGCVPFVAQLLRDIITRAVESREDALSVHFIGLSEAVKTMGKLGTINPFRTNLHRIDVHEKVILPPVDGKSLTDRVRFSATRKSSKTHYF